MSGEHLVLVTPYRALQLVLSKTIRIGFCFMTPSIVVLYIFKYRIS